jgi:hypothetical protein
MSATERYLGAIKTAGDAAKARRCILKSAERADNAGCPITAARLRAGADLLSEERWRSVAARPELANRLWRDSQAQWEGVELCRLGPRSADSGGEA